MLTIVLAATSALLLKRRRLGQVGATCFVLAAAVNAEAVLLAAPPAAQAAAFDVPLPPTEGVTLTVKDERVTMRVSAKTFRAIAGKPALLRCFGAGGGETGTSARVPRKRAPLSFGFVSREDFCMVATRGHPSVDGCLRVYTQGTWCVRAAAPLTDAGRAYLDDFARTAELSTAFTATESGPDYGRTMLQTLQANVDVEVVGLPTPDAAPPQGSIGYFEEGTTSVIATVLADGRVRYIRCVADVYATNDPRIPANLEKLSFFTIKGQY
jgi:hypothetical protein